jgi:1-deoxy-D-xylulose 5-phosphate reductoisomerase
MVVVNCLNSGFSVCVILQIYFELLISQLNISYPLTLVHPVQKLELVKTQLLSFQHTIAADFARFSCIEYALEQVNFLV